MKMETLDTSFLGLNVYPASSVHTLRTVHLRNLEAVH